MMLHQSPHLHAAQTEVLARAARPTRSERTVRLALATLLAALAHRLAPDLPDRPRLRAAPN